MTPESSNALIVPDHYAGLNYYRTPQDQRVPLLARLAPSVYFYSHLLYIVSRDSLKVRRGRYNGLSWSEGSFDVLEKVQEAGAKVEIEGLEHVRALGGPAVYVANHMSTLETFVLPSVIRPHGPATFVVKRSLLDYPGFGKLLATLRPIAVGRSNPREDLMRVMNEGKQLLSEGISVVVFPQTTRTDDFDTAKFNSIGAKLAARAEVPLVPLALLTNAWGQGRWIKDFGPFHPERPVRMRFGAPIPPEGKGDEAHRVTCEFIGNALNEWKEGNKL